MRKTLTTITLAATIGAGALAATLPASAAVTWKAQTCTAFTAYQAHPGAARLATLVTDSTHLSRGWLKADVLEAAATISSPSSKAAEYVAKALTDVAEDCAR